MEESVKWDTRFLELAKLVSTWSKDPSTQTGAVIVQSDRSVLSIGYNGFPRKMEDKLEWYNDREEKYSRIVHCEINALIQAKAPITGCTLYTYPFMSCDRCVVQMIQAGITKFVFPKAKEKDKERWGVAFSRVEQYLKETGIEWREY